MSVASFNAVCAAQAFARTEDEIRRFLIPLGCAHAERKQDAPKSAHHEPHEPQLIRDDRW
jgi:hypothetical protein